MKTTIRVSKDLLHELKKRKVDNKDSYEGVIWDLIENTLKINNKTKCEIKKARADIRNGKFYTFEQVKQKLGM